MILLTSQDFSPMEISELNMWGGNGDSQDEDDFGQDDELVFDDNLGPIERINKYMRSDVTLHRLHIVKDLSDSAKAIGYKTSYSVIVPALQEMNNDKEAAVRHALVEQTVELAKYFKLADAGEEGYHHILHSLLPIVAGYTTDTNPQVRQSSTEALVEIGKLLETDHLMPHLLPIVKSLAKDATEEEHRVQGAQLLNNLAPFMPKSLCIDFSIPHVKTLAKDSVFRVRKAVASHMGNICKSVGVEETTEKLLPIFVQLASDDIWGVRKACAESLVFISDNVSIEKRTEDLTRVYEVLSKDSSRWVISAASQALGPFIATFVGHPVPTSLLNAFCSMVPEPSSSSVGESGNINNCAFTFPAVLQTLGKDGWASLSVTYENLVKDPQCPVRKSLAFSLHEVAKILGTELSEAYLLQTLELFLRDLDDVKVGVVSHLAEFFEVLSENTRKNFIHVLKSVLEDDKWRVRKLLAKQVGALAKLYSPELVSKEIVAIFMGLLNDDVAVVRKAVIKSYSSLSSALNASPEDKDVFVQQVVSLATDPKYHKRQLFGMLCEKAVALHDPITYETELLPHLLILTNDKVPNVRFVAARAIKSLTEVPYFEANDPIHQAFKRLSEDSDQEVAFFASGNYPARLHSYLPKPAKSNLAGQKASSSGAGASTAEAEQ